MNILTHKQIKQLLSGEQSELIKLIYNDLMNSKEAASELGVSFRTVHVRLKKEGIKIGIDNLTPLMLKKAKLIELKKSGVSLSELKRIGGYKTYYSLEYLF